MARELTQFNAISHAMIPQKGICHFNILEKLTQTCMSICEDLQHAMLTMMIPYATELHIVMSERFSSSHTDVTLCVHIFRLRIYSL